MARFKIPTQVALGARLKEVRLQAGRTQADVASSLDRPQSYVAKVEAGQHGLGAVDMVYFAAALGIEPEVLLSHVLEVVGYREGGTFRRTAPPSPAQPASSRRSGSRRS